MEDNKLVPQTVYVPGSDYNTQYFVYIKNKAGYIYVEKKENQIVISVDAFRSIVSNAQMFSFAWGIELCNFKDGKKQSDTYINNLFII